MKYKNGKIVFSIILLLLSVTFINFQSARAESTPIPVEQRQQYDIDKGCTTHLNQVPNMEQILTYFNCGHTQFLDNGTTIRKFTLIIEENHKLPITLPEDTVKNVMWPAWTFNSSIPGPTMRMTTGDHVEVTVINKGQMPHSLHMHSIHAANMDGVPIVSGDSGLIAPSKSFTYKFTAAPAGIFVYHCHMNPISEHINRGLYGGMIIDQPATHAKSQAKEIVMYLSGFDLSIHKPYPSMINSSQATALMNEQPEAKPAAAADSKNKNNDKPDPNAKNQALIDAIAEEHDNSFYAVNGMSNYYMHHPIQVGLHEPLRIYVFNMLDFEINSFHLHGQVFKYYPSGISNTPTFTNDVVNLSQGDRGIMETQFNFPGNYMTHAHISQIGDRGWSALFSVK